MPKPLPAVRIVAPREQQVMVPTQEVLIATSLILASAFLWGYLKWRARQPLLLVGAIMLGAAAGYETYMHFVWEPTVHAPIRLDVFVLICH
jgi:CHASE2 domain-containing sensor protein